MTIHPDDIDKIRSCDLVSIVSEHVALRKVGTRYSGLCPFHTERSASFTVNPARGFYHCFGCSAHGSIIDFVMNIEAVNFVDACERIAARNNITLTHDNPIATRAHERRLQLRGAIAAATTWYHQQLLSSADAEPARAYLAARGIEPDTIAQFRLGWAPAKRDALITALALPHDIARDAGLAALRNGRTQDFFHGRVLFPITDLHGHVVAFGGRVLPGTEGPKYINTPETTLYVKSKALYGLFPAKQRIVADGEVIVCEGYTDVLAFHQAGMPRAVATCGTALTEDHIKTLANFTRRVIVAFDADAAGQNAAIRFHEWERRFDLDLMAVSMPAGTDPADLAQHDPAQLRVAVKQARPFLEFRLERHWKASNLETPEGRARAFERAMEMINEHPNALVREFYGNQAADAARISPTHVTAALHTPTSTRERIIDGARRPVVSLVESGALAALVHCPDQVVAVVDPCLFRDHHARTLCAALLRSDFHGTLESLRQEGNAELEALLVSIAADNEPTDPIDAIARLVNAAVGRLTNNLVHQQRLGTLDTAAVSATITALRDHARNLNIVERQRETLNVLVPWLVSYHQERTAAKTLA